MPQPASSTDPTPYPSTKSASPCTFLPAAASPWSAIAGAPETPAAPHVAIAALETEGDVPEFWHAEIAGRIHDAVVAEADASVLLASACSGDECDPEALAALCDPYRWLGPSAVLPESARAAGLRSRPDGVLFGEGQSRFVISCPVASVASLMELAQGALSPTPPPCAGEGLRASGPSPAHGGGVGERALPLTQIGGVGGDTFSWSDILSVPVKELARAWNTPF